MWGVQKKIFMRGQSNYFIFFGGAVVKKNGGGGGGGGPMRGLELIMGPHGQ